MDMNCLDQHHHERFSLYNGDSCELLAGLPSGCADYSIFSPPFVDLFCYSGSDRDLGNCKSYADFFVQFGFIVAELMRVVKPGRNISVHCMDLPRMKERDGVIGLRDFPGDIIRCFEQHGAVYHSRVLVTKDPLIEATRTKAIGLMHKQLCKDSIICRMGLPDYILTFRTHGENAAPIAHPSGLMEYAGKIDPGGVAEKRSHNIWRRYASNIWTDIRQTLTLNRKGARDQSDEKHICPLQLDTIDRCLTLWSNPGEAVLTPFLGIGSEVYSAVKLGRRGIGVELKPSYFTKAVENVTLALDPKSHGELFAMDEEEEAAKA